MGVLRHIFAKDYPRYEDESGFKYRKIRRGKSKIFLVDFINQGALHISKTETHGSVRKLDRGLGDYKKTLRVS